MAGTVHAVIDVGTNSVKLLVAEVQPGQVVPLLEHSEQTRLGKGFYETRMLQTEAIQTTARVVADFAREASAHGPASIRVFATSAARDALNKSELAGAIRAATGLTLEIISGETEADWVFQGVASNPDFHGLPLLVVDVGGGSSEFVLGRNGHKRFAQSFPLGTVRFLERLRLSDPPAPSDLAECRGGIARFLEESVGPALRPELAGGAEAGLKLVGTGGTCTILARIEHKMSDFDRHKIDGTVLGKAQVETQLHRLWALPLAERQALPGLPANRADVILVGAAILAGIMDQFRFPSLHVSTRGLRFAAAMDSAEGRS